MTLPTEFCDTLTCIWKKATSLHAQGNHDHANWFSPEETAFLRGIGVTPHEIYDFAEDANDNGEPSMETFVKIHEIRRDYFLTEQQGVLSTAEVLPDSLPARNAELGGYRWLPRIIAKAKAKLRGELHREIMYGCGGDRGFLRQHGLRAEDFLQAVRDHENDEDAILQWLAKHSKSQAP